MLIPGERRQELQRGKNAVTVVPQASGVWAPELGLAENHCAATSLMSSREAAFVLFFNSSSIWGFLFGNRYYVCNTWPTFCLFQ